MWNFVIIGRGKFWSAAGRSFEKRLHSIIRCGAVCSTFSGQLQRGVGDFFIWWRYEWKQPWFVRSWVRKWFGQRERDFLWKMEGMSGLVWCGRPFRSLYMLHPRFVCKSLPVAASLWKLVLCRMWCWGCISRLFWPGNLLSCSLSGLCALLSSGRWSSSFCRAPGS